MASPVEIQQELARRKIQEALAAQAGAQHDPRLRGPSVGASSDPRIQAIDRSRQARGVDIVTPRQPGPGTIGTPADLGGALGATGGAALGAAAGNLPGAALGGLMGGQLGRDFVHLLMGEAPVPEEWRGLEGFIDAGGPLAGKIAQTAGRFLGKLPTEAGAKKAMDLAERQRVARQQVASAPERQTQLEAEIAAGEAGLQKTRAIIEQGKLPPLPSAGAAKSRDAVLDRELERVRRLVNARKAEREALLRKLPVETAAAKVTAGEKGGWGFGTAAGAAAGAIASGLEGGVTGGAIGFILHRMRGPIAERLAANPTFVRWASGLSGQPATAALSTFITEVVANASSQPELDALSAFSDMMEEVASERLPSFIPEAEPTEDGS